MEQLQPAMPPQLSRLFVDESTKQVSQYHLLNSIILNPHGLIELLHPSSDLDILRHLTAVLNDFPLNYVNVACNCEIFTKLVEAAIGNTKIGAEDPQRQERGEVLMRLFDGFLSAKDPPLAVFKRLNSLVVQDYYSENLTSSTFETALRLTCKIYERLLGVPSGRGQSFIYLLSAGDQLRVEMSNSKWPFGKGLCIKAWLHPQLCKSKKESILWLLKTEDKKELELKLVCEELFFTYSKNGQPQDMVPVGSLVCGSWNSLSIELEPSGGFSFGGHHYQLNIGFNQNNLRSVNIELPKFSSSEFVTDFILFRNFVGRVSWVMVSSVAGRDGPAYLSEKDLPRAISEPVLHDILSADLLKRDQIFAFYLPSRSYCGLLLNVLGNETNNGVFTGLVSNSTASSLDQYWHLEPLLPYFYLSRQLPSAQEKSRCFSAVLELYVSSLKVQPTYIRYLLYITYFCISDNYECIDARSLELFVQLLEIGSPVVRDCLSQLSLEHLLKRQSLPEKLKLVCNMPSKSFYQVVEADWKRLWSDLQSFCRFWAHPGFRFQRDKPFDARDFVYNPSVSMFYQWSISNFITKEWARPLIEPVFREPAPKTEKFVIELETRECHALLAELDRVPVAAEKEMGLQRIPSKTQRLKSLLSSKTSTSSRDSKKEEPLEPKWSEYRTDCVWINHLTVIVGSLEVDFGELRFTSGHVPVFDHMAICSWKSKDVFTMRWKLSAVESIKKRRFNQTRSSIEIFFADTSSYVFYLMKRDVDVFLAKLSGVKLYRTPLEHFTQSNKPDDWIDRKISNFEYLMWLNFVSGRSYQDLTQYPVFPWLFVGFGAGCSQSDLSNFRDLSKNMGNAGHESRKKYFIEKYESKNEYELVSEYHYGTHYSSSAIICNFLIRLKPYSDGAMSLQSGKFDVADRVFGHYEDSWVNATTSPSDVRQLIPDFYVLPEMFVNLNNYDFGTTQTKERIDNVMLPKWTNGSPYLFVAVLRRAVQSDYVSKNLSLWVDLVYGYKQRGREAINEMNIFYHLTYEDSLDLESVTEEAERLGFESQIAHFGQTPSQIIAATPHPVRGGLRKNHGRLLSDGSQAKIMKNLDRNDVLKKPSTVIFNSVLEHPHSVLATKFYRDNMYVMFKRSSMGLYKISRSQKKEVMITKEQTLAYDLETVRQRLDVRSLQGCVSLPVEYLPVLKAFFIAGYYFGYVNVIFYDDLKQNQFAKLADCTITAMARHERTVMVGSLEGQLNIYSFSASFSISKVESKFDHQAKVTDITVAPNQNLYCTCGEDSMIFLYNLFSHRLLRCFDNPASGGKIGWVRISSSPLFCVIFYSPANKTVYSYSINGQYLNHVMDASDMFYPPFVQKDSNHTDTLVGRRLLQISINAAKTVQVWDLPFLDCRRKIQLKKNDTPRISCFECNPESTVAVVGTIEGHAYILMDPESY